MEPEAETDATPSPPPAGRPEPAGDGGEAQGGYEFRPDEDAHFLRLATSLRAVGQAQFVAALALGLVALFAYGEPAGLLTALTALGEALVFLASGAWSIHAAGALAMIIRTEGSDVDHLMAAVDGLHGLFVLQRLLILLGLVVVAAYLVQVFAFSG